MLKPGKAAVFGEGSSESTQEISITNTPIKGKILLEKTGNIAEAALQLNHIFEDAQEAAEQYLASVRKKAIEMYGEAALQMDPDYVTNRDET